MVICILVYCIYMYVYIFFLRYLYAVYTITEWSAFPIPGKDTMSQKYQAGRLDSIRIAEKLRGSAVETADIHFFIFFLPAPALDFCSALDVLGITQLFRHQCSITANSLDSTSVGTYTKEKDLFGIPCAHNHKRSSNKHIDINHWSHTFCFCSLDARNCVRVCLVCPLTSKFAWINCINTSCTENNYSQDMIEQRKSWSRNTNIVQWEKMNETCEVLLHCPKAENPAPSIEARCVSKYLAGSPHLSCVFQ